MAPRRGRLAEHDVIGPSLGREHGIMTAVQAAAAGDAVGLEQRKRRGKRLDPGQMRAIGAGARDQFRFVFKQQCDIAPLHDLGHRLGAVDERALVGGARRSSTAAISAADKRRFELRRERGRIVERRGDEIKPLGRRMQGHAALRSRSAFHWPMLASPFIMARWAKARCAAATFSDLPDHTVCGACCSARP